MRQREAEVVSIQYLRGVAALLVVVAHACDQFVAGPVEPLLRLIGQGGVDIFFVISGYVMTYTTAVHRYDRPTFFRRRIARIVPLYWTLTLFTAVLLAAAGGLSRVSRFAWSDLFTSLSFVPHYNAGQPGAIAPTLKLGWTLNYEMFFYAWFGAFIACSAGARLVCLSLVFSALVGLTLLLHPIAAPLAFWGNPVVLEFLFGCAIGWYDLNGSPERIPRSVWLAALAAGTIAFFALGAADQSLAWRVLLRGIPGAIVVLAAIGFERRAARLRRSGLLHYLGDASYSIYLSHLFAIVGLRVVWLKLHVPHASASDALVFALCAVAAGTACGCLVYSYVERPLTGLVKRGAMGIGSRADTPPETGTKSNEVESTQSLS